MFDGSQTAALPPSRSLAGPQGSFAPWRTASCSSGLECNVQEFGGGFPMFEALGDDSEGEGLHARDGFIPVGTVAHDADQVWHLG